MAVGQRHVLKGLILCCVNFISIKKKGGKTKTEDSQIGADNTDGTSEATGQTRVSVGHVEKPEQSP